MLVDAQPLSSILWVPRETIKPNDYNPNFQFTPEHRLLAISILVDGWTQPIVVGSDYVIIDGEHRWKVSAMDDVRKLTDGLVPIVKVEGDRGNRQCSTIRHNRARGEHSVEGMAGIVKDLLESYDVEDVMMMLGMEREEVERLSETAGMPDIVSRKSPKKLGKGWVPK